MGSGAARSAKAHYGLIVVDTKGHGGCQSQPMVVAMVMVTTFLPSCFGFLRGLSFFHAIFRFCVAILPLKVDVFGFIWAWFP